MQKMRGYSFTGLQARLMLIPAVEEVIIYYLYIGSIHPAEKRRMIQSCTRREVLFRGRGVGLREWRMSSDKAR
jgi:hypothetical protein